MDHWLRALAVQISTITRYVCRCFSPQHWRSAMADSSTSLSGPPSQNGKMLVRGATEERNLLEGAQSLHLDFSWTGIHNHTHMCTYYGKQECTHRTHTHIVTVFVSSTTLVISFQIQRLYDLNWLWHKYVQVSLFLLLGVQAIFNNVAIIHIFLNKNSHVK